jgi:hypothetical protein
MLCALYIQHANCQSLLSDFNSNYNALKVSVNISSCYFYIIQFSRSYFNAYEETDVTTRSVSGNGLQLHCLAVYSR